MRGLAFFAYATNYLIDTQHAVILDVEATRAIRQAEVGAARTMLERTAERFGLKPQHLAADSAYGSADTLAWLVKEKKIAPHSRSSTRQTVPTARSHAPTSCLIQTRITTPALATNVWCSTAATSPTDAQVLPGQAIRLSELRSEGTLLPQHPVAPHPTQPG